MWSRFLRRPKDEFNHIWPKKVSEDLRDILEKFLSINIDNHDWCADHENCREKETLPDCFELNADFEEMMGQVNSCIIKKTNELIKKNDNVLFKRQFMYKYGYFFNI